jgi:hypothetical protein
MSLFDRYVNEAHQKELHSSSLGKRLGYDSLGDSRLLKSLSAEMGGYRPPRPHVLRASLNPQPPSQVEIAAKVTENSMVQRPDVRRAELSKIAADIEAEIDEITAEYSVEHVAGVLLKKQAVDYLQSLLPEKAQPQNDAAPADSSESRLSGLTTWITLLERERARIRRECDALEATGRVESSVAWKPRPLFDELVAVLRALNDAKVCLPLIKKDARPYVTYAPAARSKRRYDSASG